MKSTPTRPHLCEYHDNESMQWLLGEVVENLADGEIMLRRCSDGVLLLRSRDVIRPATPTAVALSVAPIESRHHRSEQEHEPMYSLIHAQVAQLFTWLTRQQGNSHRHHA